MFIVFWRRWGFLGLLFPVVGFLLWIAIGTAVSAIMHTVPGQGIWNLIALAVGFGAAAIGSWIFAVRFVEPVLDHPDKNLPRSTLFFMPVRYWSFVTVALGVLFLIPNAIETFT